jgi:hypothetical protein
VAKGAGLGSPSEKKVSDLGLSNNTKNADYFAPNLLIQMKKIVKALNISSIIVPLSCYLNFKQAVVYSWRFLSFLKVPKSTTYFPHRELGSHQHLPSSINLR